MTVSLVGLILILIILNIKYKPVYEVKIEQEVVGYIENINNFQEIIEEEILNDDESNIAYVSFIEEPTYELKLISRTQDSTEEEVIEELKENTITTYIYYEVALNDETQACVDTLEEAEQLVNEIKEEYEDDLELDLAINEKYTQDKDSINTESLEVATSTVEAAAIELKEEQDAIAIVNEVKFSVLPVTGTITSRYGERSSIRSSTHTGLDIAATTGTNIQVVAGGTVTFAAYNGSYGNLVKIDHGNGVETWYGHCSKIYVKVGEQVDAGDVIAAVGSTGNSTGPHLHFEIRINGSTVNPQNYVY